jgi:hypothetical protein
MLEVWERGRLARKREQSSASWQLVVLPATRPDGERLRQAGSLSDAVNASWYRKLAACATQDAASKRVEPLALPGRLNDACRDSKHP